MSVFDIALGGSRIMSKVIIALSGQASSLLGRRSAAFLADPPHLCRSAVGTERQAEKQQYVLDSIPDDILCGSLFWKL
jgi:hypothetical protein